MYPHGSGRHAHMAGGACAREVCERVRPRAIGRPCTGRGLRICRGLREAPNRVRQGERGAALKPSVGAGGAKTAVRPQATVDQRVAPNVSPGRCHPATTVQAPPGDPQ